MAAVVMDEEKLSPYEVVLFFQSCLNEAGNPIEFTRESGLPIQLNHAKRLIAACKCNRKEIQDVIRTYCAEEWWVRNQPSLHQVVKRLDELRARLAGAHGFATSWEEL